MAVSKIDVVDRFFDDNGALLAGGLVHTYVSGTTTQLATYQDAAGGGPNENPAVLDSSGNGTFFFTRGVAYDVRITDANGVSVGRDLEGLIVAGDSTISTGAYIVPFEHLSAIPITLEVMGLHSFDVAVTFPINFAGSTGVALTNPTASFVITVKKNGSTVGTVTIGTGGVFTFATSGSATVAFAINDYMHLLAPAGTDATLMNLTLSFLGSLA